MTSDLIALLSSLVAIDSVNPSLVAGGAGEQEIAGLIECWARDAGLETERLEQTPGRPSVLVHARGRGGGRTLLLCGHIDTVSVEAMPDPHTPRIDGDRLCGRGAYDMKAGVAAALIAARAVSRLGLAGDVVVAAVADEEHSSLGVQEALSNVSADAAVVSEPTELQLVVAHKGFIWSEVEVSGRSAHGSRPHLGVDAILKMGAVLNWLAQLDRSLAQRTHPLLGRASVHASLIEGGIELSSYPAHCKLALERRTLPGETAEQIEAELEGLLHSCREADAQLQAAQRTLLVREPFEIDQQAELVALVAQAAAEVLSEPPTIGGASYWADSAFIAAAGIPTLLFGPGGEGAHATEEWVSLSDTEAVSRTLVGLATRLRMRAVVNRALDSAAVPAPSDDAAAFHRALPGYAPTPVHQLDAVASELGVAAVQVKDESSRLGLPAFKILGASWAVQRALRDDPAVHTLLAASAGNHGRAVAHVAAVRGLACRVFLPERSLALRREAIAAEGAQVVVVDGTYEDAVEAAARAATEGGTALIADVGQTGSAEWVIEGYATLFAEAGEQAGYDLILVPVGVGSLAAAAARHGAQVGAQVVGVEPATAACLSASLARGVPTVVPTPGTTMAGLDCAEVSPAAWPSLRRGVAATVTISDDEADAAMRELSANGFTIGESGAAPLAGLRALQQDEDCRALREHLATGPQTRVLLIASEGTTGAHAL